MKIAAGIITCRSLLSEYADVFTPDYCPLLQGLVTVVEGSRLVSSRDQSYRLVVRIFTALQQPPLSGRAKVETDSDTPLIHNLLLNRCIQTE